MDAHGRTFVPARASDRITTSGKVNRAKPRRKEGRKRGGRKGPRMSDSDYGHAHRTGGPCGVARGERPADLELSERAFGAPAKETPACGRRPFPASTGAPAEADPRAEVPTVFINPCLTHPRMSVRMSVYSTGARPVLTRAYIQGRVYNFLERPSGWKCFAYHFTV